MKGSIFHDDLCCLLSTVSFDANQSREYKCSLFTQEISHVCNGTIICYLPFLELQKNSLKPPEEPAAADIMMIFLHQIYVKKNARISQIGHQARGNYAEI